MKSVNVTDVDIRIEYLIKRVVSNLKWKIGFLKLCRPISTLEKEVDSTKIILVITRELVHPALLLTSQNT